MRILDCDCGATLQGANDDDLFREARKHADEKHADMDLSDDQIRGLISERAYEASDS
jgi:predicted small metal-binding protein